MIKLFFKKLLIITLPVVFIIGGINYFIDPANIFFSKDYIKGIAAILSQGNNVDNISNYDERLLQEQMVLQLKKTPDIIVLGSSRIMEVGSDFFPGKRVLNCGVSHANIKDLIAITGMLDSKGNLPKEIILNIDAGLVAEGYSKEWESLKGYYSSFITQNVQTNILVNEPIPFNISKQLSSILSVEYFQAALDFVIKKKSKKYVNLGKERPLLGGRFFDGTIAYKNDYMSPNPRTASLIAEETGKKIGIGNPDNDQKKLLNILLNFFTKKKVLVRMYMLPYHSKFYVAVNKFHDDVLIEYEQYFKEIASTYNYSIEGSFNPTKCNIPDTMFYDMYHSSKMAIKSIVVK